MGEVRELVIVLTIAVILAFAGFWVSGVVSSLFEGDLVVSDYQVAWSYDGALQESYQYSVKVDDTYRSLNRFFQVPVSYGTSDSALVELIQSTPPQGAHTYLKDYSGAVHLDGGSAADKQLIQKNAKNNEAGAFKSDFYPTGTWPVIYSWIISPPIERGADADHLNIDLARDHVAYQSVTITIPADLVLKVYPHPAGMTVTKTGDSYIISGSAEGDVQVGFELVLDRGAGDAIHGRISDLGSVQIQDKVNAANPWYADLLTATPYISYFGSIILICSIPVLLLLIWYRRGREKPFTIPDHLSMVP
ncbi:MAG: DUF2207 domain-containing protein, partial [Methanospirillum sp.]|uniref:DUF2207 domain-containing protein n=1 Tax=Methanospirillum sp. TaxID=45200 RepID=UPI0023709558